MRQRPTRPGARADHERLARLRARVFPESVMTALDSHSRTRDRHPHDPARRAQPGEPAITSPLGSRLGLENWKRSVKWRHAIIEIGRPTLRVHDLRHTYASLARRAGADLRLLQKTMGHASITVTAHIYADLYDDELDVVASALNALDDRQVDGR